MNFAKKIYARKTISVLDFGSENVYVLIAHRKESGKFEILGGGDAKSSGLKNGEFVYVGDAVESVVEATRKAEKSAGFKIDSIYYNVDDVKMESFVSAGSKVLSGEGQISLRDIQTATDVAHRVAGRFEKKVLYSAQTQYVIDDRDPVANPVGIFGRKLDVTLHVLAARSDYLDLWSQVMQRAHFRRSVPALSLWSSVKGVFGSDPSADRKIFWDMGNDLLNVGYLEGGRLVDYRGILTSGIGATGISGMVEAVSADFLKRHPAALEIALTGDLAESFSISPLPGLTSKKYYPAGAEKLTEPKYSALVGLLSVASDAEREDALIRPERGLVADLKEKTAAFINDYF